jgi:ribose transport system permease protein
VSVDRASRPGSAVSRTGGAVPDLAPTTSARSSRKLLGTTAIRYSGAVGIAALVVLFTLYLPNLFFTEVTLRSIVANVAITGILALAAVVPLAAGVFDLQFAAVAGLSLVITVELSTRDMSLWTVSLIAILCAGACGLVGGALVAFLQLDSLIVTLGSSSVILGLAMLITDGTTLFGEFPQGFKELGQGTRGPIPNLAFVLVALALVVWIWLEHTPAGRYTLAVGSNPIAARLAGLSVARTHLMVMLVSSLIAGMGGVLLAAQVGNGSTATGPGYLLPALAAVFLGATQVRERPNVVGTMIAIFLLGTGIKGLQLSGAATWVTPVFNGGVLILAVAAAALRSRRAAVGH